MIYGYARVSTKGQAQNGNSLEDQCKQLKAAGAETIIEEAFTGTKTDRPEFSKLVDRLTAGDTLIVTKLDRFARTLVAGVETIQQLMERGVTVNVLNMGVVSKSATGMLTIQIMLAFAEYERNMIVERTTAGKEESGNYGGRKKAYTKAQMDHAIDLLNGHSYNQVAEMTGISKSTIIREARARGFSKG